MGLLKSTEFLVKDLVFWLAGFLLKKGRPERIPVDPAKIKKVLFMRYDKIGDMIVSLPVFDTLKKRYPHIEISILCSPGNYPVIKNDPRFATIYIYRKNVVHDFKQLLAMRRENFDCAVDLVKGDSTSAVFLTRFSVGDKPRIGLQKKKFQRYYDYSHWDDSEEIKHILYHTLVVLGPFGIDPETAETRAYPHLSREAKAKADEFVTNLLSDSNNSARPMLVGVNLSVGQPTRKWPTKKYQELLDRISRDRGERVRLILFTAPNERMLADRLLETSRNSLTQIPPNLSLEEASAIISKLDLMISPDTSIIHIARAFDLPVVGLYTRARINFRQWHPFEFARGTVVSNDDNGLRDISVEAVYAKFNEITDSSHKTSKEAS